MNLYENITRVMIGETKETQENGYTPSEIAMWGHADKMSELANKYDS